MVTAREIEVALKVPRHQLYRLVKAKRVPAIDVTEDWHVRPQYRFCLADVRAALERIKQQRA